MPLCEAERHERLTGIEWNEDRARDANDRIVTDTHRSFDPDAMWPIHPIDRLPERPPKSIKYLYHGAAGVIWALGYLGEAGATSVKRDYLSTVRQLIPQISDDIDRYPEVRKHMGAELASYMLGEAGILLLQYKLAPSEDTRTDCIAISKQASAIRAAWHGAGPARCSRRCSCTSAPMTPAGKNFSCEVSDRCTINGSFLTKLDAIFGHRPSTV